MENIEYVILVDETGNELGVMEKLKAHKEAKLHKAFSVFLFDNQGRFLLQRRAADKYHCGGLWTNTCCSHPRPGEETGDAARRRLKEEMGIAYEPEFSFSFVYKAQFSNGLTEYELDNVFTGTYEGTPEINPKEVDSYRWITPEELLKEIEEKPEVFTPWFKIALPEVMKRLKIQP